MFFEHPEFLASKGDLPLKLSILWGAFCLVSVAGIHHESFCQDDGWWAKVAQVKGREQVG